MSEARFILKEPNSTDKTLIYLLFRYNNLKAKISTGEKIHPKFWNPTKQRARELSDQPGNSILNDTLSFYSKVIEKIYKRFKSEGVLPTVEQLKSEFEIAVGRGKAIEEKIEEPKLTFIDFIKNHIEISKSIMRKATITSYNTTLRHLQEFQAKTGFTVDFNSINMEFYSKFIDYLINEKKIYNNTIGKYIKNVKAFLRVAEEQYIVVCQDYKSRKFKTLGEDADTIYLTNNELDQLYKLDLSDNVVLDETRDVFLIGAYTGLRYSDFSRLQKEHIIKQNGNEFIRILTKKSVGGGNGEEVVIPLRKVAKEILKKYDYHLPRYIEGKQETNHLKNDAMNVNLKKIGKKLKLTEGSIVNRTRGTEVISTTVQKFERIQTHTARRSFATNAYLGGLPVISIKEITGHKTEKSFLRYIRISAMDSALKIADHEFFKN